MRRNTFIWVFSRLIIVTCRTRRDGDRGDFDFDFDFEGWRERGMTCTFHTPPDTRRHSARRRAVTSQQRFQHLGFTVHIAHAIRAFSSQSTTFAFRTAQSFIHSFIRSSAKHVHVPSSHHGQDSLTHAQHSTTGHTTNRPLAIRISVSATLSSQATRAETRQYTNVRTYVPLHRRV
jgi:hypothetical protein